MSLRKRLGRVLGTLAAWLAVTAFLTGWNVLNVEDIVVFHVTGAHVSQVMQVLKDRYV